MACTGVIHCTPSAAPQTVRETTNPRTPEPGQTRAEDKATLAAVEDRNTAGSF
jgi:hypothetical protein